MLRRTFLALTAAALAAQEKGAGSAKLGDLAYIQRRSLWIKSLPDGTPRILASGDNLRAPKFSPSGQWILFGNGDDLLSLVPVDGKMVKSRPSESGQWLPGDRLAVLLDGHTLVFGPDDGWTSPQIALPGSIGAVSPDGSQRIFESTDDSGTRLLAGPFDRPTEAKLVDQTKEGGFETIAFARGRSRFLYWKNEEDGADSWTGPLDIYLASGAKSAKTGTAALPTNLGANVAPLSPSADALAIVVGDDGNVTIHNKSIALLDISSDSSQPLRKITGPSVSAIYPAFSPDGSQLAWCQGPDADVLFKQMPPDVFYEVAMDRAVRERRIWLAGNGGLGEPKQLTDDTRYLDEMPVWSRDGCYVLFVRTDRHDISTLWLMRSDGSEAREVAAPSEKGDGADFELWDLFDWSFRF